VKKRRFGRDDTGHPVEEIVLESDQAAVAILSYGCVVRDWRIDGPNGSLPMVLGFPRLEDYLHHARSHGAIVGRVANRTANSRFALDGRTYELTPSEGAHHLHGGPVGLGKRVWEMEGDSASGSVQLTYASPDGEQGYPGNVLFSVTYRLDGATLVCEMAGRPDQPTPINLANHNYYNLGGGGQVRDHLLWIDAREYTPVGPDLIPDGTLRSVEGTEFDFRVPREIGDTRLDNNLVLDPGRDKGQASARVECPRSGVRLELWTEEPGLQVFDAASMTIGVPGHDGETYGPFAGLCLEAQHFPDSLNNPDWPSVIRSPEEPYFQRLAVRIARG
jgi:aldose 1-epimerase